MPQPYLYYFTRGEFLRADGYGHDANWFDQMDSRWLVMIDILRYQWSDYKGRECKIIISPAPGALGRQMGPVHESDHNIDRWGAVMAGDCMFPDLESRDDVDALFDMAKYLTFGSIGFYPYWLPHPGFHLGSRRREPGQPATWGAIKKGDEQVYVSYRDAREAFA